jgi:hypothetical protein
MQNLKKLVKFTAITTIYICIQKSSDALHQDASLHVTYFSNPLANFSQVIRKTLTTTPERIKCSVTSDRGLLTAVCEISLRDWQLFFRKLLSEPTLFLQDFCKTLPNYIAGHRHSGIHNFIQVPDRKNAGLRWLVRYWTCSGIGIFFHSSSGLNGCLTVRHLYIKIYIYIYICILYAFTYT